MDRVEVKFGEWINGGFTLFKANLGLLILASLIAVAIGAVTVGILAGPMMAGLLIITLALLDQTVPKPEVGMVFKGFGLFLNTFLMVIVWGLATFVVSIILGLIPAVGQLVSTLIGLVMQSFMILGLLLIVDRRMDFWPASMEVINTVKTNFWPFLGLFIVASIIGSIGVILCGIGIIITTPIQACIMAAAYRDIYGGAPAEEAPGPAEEAPGPVDEPPESV